MFWFSQKFSSSDSNVRHWRSGSGKGTQCALIKSTFGYEHLSTGDILRRVVEKKENPKWEALKEKMDKGDFVSSEELLDL